MPSTTPLTPVAEALLFSSATRRCTDTIAVHQAATLDVCVSGRMVAIHCETAKGRVVIRVSLAEFTAKCRGERDHNRNVFPSPESLIVDATITDAAQTEPKELIGSRVHSREHAAACREAAWDEVKAGSTDTLEAIATRHGLTKQSFINWINLHRRTEWAPLKRAREHKANLAELAALNRPLTKPSGSL